MDAVAMIGVSIAGATGICGVLLYVVRSEQDKETARLDGRINAHEAGCTVRQTALADTLRDIKERGERLEDKIDRLVEQA
jgi:hypothetical protein